MANWLGNATVISESATINILGTVTTNWSGPQTIFAVPNGASSTTGEAVAIVVLPDSLPVVDGVTASLTPPPGPTIDTTLPATGATLVESFTATSSLETHLGISGASLVFTAYQFDSTTGLYNDYDVAMYGGGDVKIYNDTSAALLHNFSYTTWADFQASTDYDPVFWNDIAFYANQLSVTYFNGLVGPGSVGSDTLTLTANAYSPNGTIASVQFFKGSSTSSGDSLGTITSPDDNGNWSLAINPSSLGGSTTVTVVVTDSAGAVTTSTESIGSGVVAGNLWASSPTYYNGYNENITLSGALTLNSGASISGVKFYLDTSGTQRRPLCGDGLGC